MIFVTLLSPFVLMLPAPPRSGDHHGQGAGGARACRHLHSGYQPRDRAAVGRRQMTVAAKICGLSTEAAVTAAVAGGAAYLGFVFYSPSPRAVTAGKAARLCAAVPSGVARVGLFVDADDDTIGAVLTEAPIDILQFHGRESPAR